MDIIVLPILVFGILILASWILAHNEPPVLKVKKLTESIKLPHQATNGSAGYDIYHLEPMSIVLKPGDDYRAITGIAFQIPKGYVGLIQPRSSAFLRGLWVNGVIDEDYTGAIQLLFKNISNQTLILEPNKCYAQMLLLPYGKFEVKLVNELDKTDRGGGGFGSTHS